MWRLLPYFSDVLPVHAALLHTGAGALLRRLRQQRLPAVIAELR
jgi:hypothetical protein